jgi:hypothetical protein
MQLLNERHGPLLDLIGPLLSTVDQNLVNTMLNTLLIWLQQPGWAKKIYSALLWVANRVTPKEADVLNAGLAEYWLDSAVPEARCLGLRLIARMYTLQGAPLDMPGQRYAVVALDASRKGRSSHVAESGQGIYVHYAGRVDTYMFSMGQRKPTACPGQIPTTAQLRPLFNLPRLLAGALEGLGNCAPSHMHFLLAWTSENILDADDLDEVVFHDRIIIASPDEKAVRWRNDLDFVRVNRNPSSQDFLMVEEKINQCLGQRLAALEPDDWWVVLKPHLSYDPIDIEGICDQLESWAVCLDQPEPSAPFAESTEETLPDKARIIACTILWMVKANLYHCLNLLREWLAAPPEDLRNLMGQACCKLIFNVYGQQVPPPSFETLGPVLSLAPIIIETKNWGAIESVLRAVRSWLIAPDWANNILNGVLAADVTGPSVRRINLLSILVDNTSGDYREKLKQILEEWRSDPNAPAAVARIAEQMSLRLALGEGGKFPELLEGSVYGLILLDSSRESNPALAQVAIQMIKELENTNYGKKFSPVVCRMGQRLPVEIGTQSSTADELLPKELSPLPCLAAPLLEQVDPHRVGFILILANGLILDVEDWIDDWNDVPIIQYSSIRTNISVYPPPVVAIHVEEKSAVQKIIGYVVGMTKG